MSELFKIGRFSRHVTDDLQKGRAYLRLDGAPVCGSARLSGQISGLYDQRLKL